VDTGSRDRGSLEWLLERGYVQGLVTGGVGLIFTALLQGKGYIPANLLVTLLGAFFFFHLGAFIARSVGKIAGGAASSLYTPSGDSTAYTPTFSHIDTLVIRGDFDGAATAWEVAILENPTNPGVLVKAADFHLRERREPSAALSLYLRARQLNLGGDDLRRYIQQKIVDLYLGPLNDEGRAMSELRRLIDAFPQSREAEAAREALAAIKAKREPQG
jgi:hypothetical protein